MENYHQADDAARELEPEQSSKKSPKKKPQLKPENPSRDIRLAAMNLLARREHGYQELLTKLGSKFSKSEHHPPELITEQLQILREQGLQSDERFVEAFINSKKNSGKGPMVVRQQLQQKGLKSEQITLALEAVEDQWFALAQALYERKYQGQPIVDHKEKARRMRFMQSRGFSFDQFIHLLDLAKV
ncbi:recombination regulator RecX [Dasania sp. GY-MA-18]|uniref:Regulatory protein RecX n=1 Tax=Dasania phycosphaerae TaxID=2950436 RepID=A0A9J6RMF2_9GAMM|nr:MULTISPECIES: regulatory protein RecX [Dasania]MCR8923469.1 recombination regulator RecX [Dasania sp. GY-MA-18]MCZ0865902.1 regulatory protein RecX [Dasania phycosphaerae]MCZ0869626.1 regulatory protein RecX [Dasania phycosphaerae]